MRRCKSNYHMSLAYGFQSSNQSSLAELQDSYHMGPQLSISWTLDLFSGDSRLSIPDSEVILCFTLNAFSSTKLTLVWKLMMLYSQTCP